MVQMVWYKPTRAQKSLIDLCIILLDLFKEMFDDQVKWGNKLSTDHHLVVWSYKFQNLGWTENCAGPAYRIKWEALVNKNVRKQFASSMAQSSKTS